jgi:integrase
MKDVEPRPERRFALQWKSYAGDRLIMHDTAFEGHLYQGKMKTKASQNAVPIPDDLLPVIEAWGGVCRNTSPDALTFPTLGRQERKGTKVPRQARNFLKWRVHPIGDRLGIPRKLVTIQVMRRTLGTDLQQHGSMKDFQQSLKHESIQTTGNIHMQEIPASVAAALNSRTRAILAVRGRISGETGNTTCPNVSQFQKVQSASV